LIGQIFCTLTQLDQRNWVEKALLVEFAINSTISSTTGFAPFELTNGMVPQMMHEVVKEEHTPPGVQSFMLKALCNMAVAHNAIIAARVFQTHHTNKKCIEEKPLSTGELVYLSTKNLSLPKGRASKLLPKFVGLYKITKAIPGSSNYELELLEELARQQIHLRFHVSLSRPYIPNDNVLFPNRSKPEAYDFGAPNGTKWFVDEITGHQWVGHKLECQVKWNLGDTT
jgi:hypothetical protein